MDGRDGDRELGFNIEIHRGITGGSSARINPIRHRVRQREEMRCDGAMTCAGRSATNVTDMRPCRLNDERSACFSTLQLARRRLGTTTVDDSVAENAATLPVADTAGSRYSPLSNPAMKQALTSHRTEPSTSFQKTAGDGRRVPEDGQILICGRGSKRFCGGLGGEHGPACGIPCGRVVKLTSRGSFHWPSWRSGWATLRQSLCGSTST